MLSIKGGCPGRVRIKKMQKQLTIYIFTNSCPLYHVFPWCLSMLLELLRFGRESSSSTTLRPSRFQAIYMYIYLFGWVYAYVVLRVFCMHYIIHVHVLLMVIACDM